MLPYLQKPKSPGVLVSNRKPDKKDEEDQEDSGGGMRAAAQDILKAIQDNDEQHLALALQNAFEIMDAAPHEEGPHTNDEDYESQNEKAGDNE
jgi:hypothetical protein